MHGSSPRLRSIAWPAAARRLRRIILVAAWWPLAAFAADPQVASFVDNPDPVAAGGVYRYTVRVDNNAPDASTNTRLTLSVPAGATFLSASPAAANCAPAPGVPTTVVVCSLGTVGAGGTDPRDVVFAWRANGPGPATINATATVSADNDTNPDPTNNSLTQVTSVVSGANLRMTLAGSPDPVVGGANISYTLTVTNAGPNDTGDLVVTNDLSPSVGFVSATGPGWTCGVAGSRVTCNRPGVHPLGTPIPPIGIVGRANVASGFVTDKAEVEPAAGAGGIADPDTSDNVATVNTQVLPGADIRIAQKAVTSPLPAVAGSNVTFAIRPRNDGPGVASNVTVTDPLPAGWTFVSAGGPNWTCANAAGTVTCTRASMPVGAVDDITLVAKAPDNAAVGASGRTDTNTASIAATSTDPDAGNNAGSVAVKVLPDGADLEISKTKSPNPVALGAVLQSIISVRNNGPQVATGTLRVVESLIGETYLKPESDLALVGTGWTCDETAPGSGLVVCDHPNAGGLAAGSTRNLTLKTRANASGNVVNTACTGGSVPPAAPAALARPPLAGDPNAANDCVSVGANSTSVQPDLAITKLTSTANGDKTVDFDESSVRYTLVVSNVSGTPQGATGIRIDDTVPAWIAGRSSFGAITVTPSAGSTASLSCTTNTTTGAVRCDQRPQPAGGVLLQGESVTVVINVNRPLTEGTHLNRARVSNTVEGDPNPLNDEASDTVTVAPIADVQMTGKTVSPASVRAGQPATYVLSFVNNGPSTAIAVTVTDTFSFAAGDAGLTVVSVAASKGSCTAAPGTQLTPASAAFTCTVGDMINGEAQSITLQVRPNWQAGNAPRSFGNLARVDTTSRESPAGGDNGNNERTIALAVQGAALDLKIEKTDLVDPVGVSAAGTFMDYRVVVTNLGPSYGTGVRFSESMVPPAGKRVRFVCDITVAGGSTCNAVPLCSAANVTSAAGTALPTFNCQLPAGDAASGLGPGELALGASKAVFLRFEALDMPAPTGDTFANTVSVSANEPDTQTANDTITETTTVRQRVDLRTSKAASVPTPTLMQPFNWIVTVQNRRDVAGGVTGDSLQTDLTDTLPAQVQLQPGASITWTSTFNPAGGTCALTGVTVRCSLGRVESGGSATVTIPVRFTSFPAGGTATNTATVDVNPAKTGGVDTPGGNNTGSHTITVTRSSLAGTVFEDRDRSGANGGTQQAGEPGVGAVTIRLTGTDDYGNAINLSTTTNAAGAYSFPSLAPSTAGLGGGYTITETQPSRANGQPADFDNGPVDPPVPATGGVYSRGGTSGDSAFAGISLPASTAGSGYNFPERRHPTLAGFVYVDRNYDGVYSGAAAGIGGATVRLFDAVTGLELRSTVTAADGSYSFTNLNPDALYTVQEPLPALPAGLVQGPVTPGRINGAACAPGTCLAQPDTPSAGTDRIAGIDLSAGADGTGFNFGERQLSFVSGQVWVDSNRDGVLQASEAGRIAGVTLTLVRGADCAGGTVLQTTTTAADGSYRFDNVEAFRGYLVCETQPAGYGTGTANGVPGNVATIAALPAAGSPNNNFGETAGSVSGKVFLDTGGGNAGNFNNGRPDAGEPGIVGVVVTLTGTDLFGNAINRSVTTVDASGAWRFDDLLPSGPGGYTVTEQAAQPVVGGVATLNGRTTAGTTAGVTNGNATSVAVAPSAISGIVLAAGADSINNHFAELLPAGIFGTVFLDLDNNGVQNAPGDVGLGGVPIVISGIDDTGAAVSITLTTQADGTYGASNLRPGTYTVTEPTQPAGTTNGLTIPGSLGGTATGPAVLPSAIGGIVLASSGATSSGNNFAELLASGSIAGRVWADDNNNGVIDAGEVGLAGVTVTLTGVDSFGAAVSLTLVTGPDGSYDFTSLRPGTYTVTEPQQPAGTVNGVTVAGSAGGTATAPNTVPSAIAGIVIGPGVRSTGNHFGEIPQSPDLRVSKAALATPWTVSRTGSYRITVRNAGDIATRGPYTVSDRLPAGLALRAVPAGNGWACTGAPGAATFTCTSSTVLATGATAADAIIAVVDVAAAAAAASPVDNAVLVDGGGEIDARRPGAAEFAAFAGNAAALPVCTAAVEHNACRTPTVVQLAASVSGTVWFDGGSTPRQLDGGDRRLPGWTVEIVDLATGIVVGTAVTAADGSYSVRDLVPGVPLAVRFRDPGSGAVFGYPVNGESAPGSSGAACDPDAAAAGRASSCAGSGAQPFLSVVLAPGRNLSQQSLPVDPSGVVYDSGLRQPVAGAVVTLAPTSACAGWDPATQIVGAGLGGYRISGAGIATTVGSDGFYQFLFAPNAPASCTFGLKVTPPAGYGAPSAAIPPVATPLVPGGAAGSVFAVQPQAAAPTGPVGSATTYYLSLVAGSAGANIVHNHIPLDPLLPGALALTKSGDRAVAEVGDSVRYTITASIAGGPRPRQVTIVDRLPAGFTYIRGSASANDQPIADPAGGLGPTLAFQLGAMPAGNTLALKYRVRVATGAVQGDGVNRAWGYACGAPNGCTGADFRALPGALASNEADYRVRVGGGVFGVEACVLGKVFVDCNHNHVQDAEELGIPGVRLVMSDGTTLVSDSEGKYSVCGLPPRSHVLRVDPLTLPRGSRMTTSSNRNLGDAGSLWLDLKNGELHRADFVEGSCSNTVLEQVKARRAQGEVRAPETEKKGTPALRFDSKAHGLSTLSSPPQGTDGANQHAPRPRRPAAPPPGAAADESNRPTPTLPMNDPPPSGRDSGTAPEGGRDGAR